MMSISCQSHSIFLLSVPIRIKNWLKLCSTCWLTQTITTSTPPGTPRRCSRVHSYVSSTAKSPLSCARTNNPRAPSTSTHLQSPGLESTGSYTHLTEIHTHTHIQQHTHNHTMQISDVSLHFTFFFSFSCPSPLLCSLHVTQSYRDFLYVCAVSYERLHAQSWGVP